MLPCLCTSQGNDAEAPAAYSTGDTDQPGLYTGVGDVSEAELQCKGDPPIAALSWYTAVDKTTVRQRFVHAQDAYAETRGERDGAVWVCGVGSRRRAPRCAPQHTPQAQSSHQWLPSPTTHRCRMRRLSSQHNAKALGRLSADGVSFSGAVQPAKPERLAHRVTFGTMGGGENPGPGRPGKT